MAKQRTVLVGISGVSCSGKTTLSRLLRDILPNTFVVHEDDYCKADDQIPVNDAGMVDWDCIESLDLPKLQEALSYIRAEGQLPEWHSSKEDQNSVGDSGVKQDDIDALKRQCHQLHTGDTRFCILDGFLLFTEDMKIIREMFDVKILLRADHKTTKERRQARPGYVTLDGFWKDPPGYVDQVVWPSHVRDHAFLYKDRDVHNELDADVCGRLQINAPPGQAQNDMTLCVRWATDIIGKVVKGNQ